MSQIRVAAIQARAEEFATNADFETQILTLCRRAREAGAELLVFPEDVGLWLEFAHQSPRVTALHALAPLITVGRLVPHPAGAPAGPHAVAHSGWAEQLLQGFVNLLLDHVRIPYFGEWLSQARIDQEYLAAFRKAAADVQLPIVGGSIYEARPDGIYNACYVFDEDGSLAGRVEKHNLIAFERAFGVVPGKEVQTVETKRYRLGACICYDLNDPAVSGELARQGAQLLCAGSTGLRPWPNYPYIPAIDCPQTQRAQETGLAVVRAYQSGWIIPGIFMDGLTDIAFPDGSVYPAVPDHRDQEQILVMEVPLRD